MKSLIKKIFLPVIFACTFIHNAIGRIYNVPLLVLDMDNYSEVLPKHFRATYTSLPEDCEALGYEELRLIGSGQFSLTALQTIVKKLGKQPLAIIDLRQESHGFINGSAISWYGKHNAANAGKPRQAIIRSEKQLLKQLKAKTQQTIWHIQCKTADQTITKAQADKIKIADVYTEAQLAKRLNLTYKRFYIEDFHAPSNNEVQRFVRYYAMLPKNAWLYFHCRAGVGRTTTFMAMVDMLKNAKRLSFESILHRQHALGGKALALMPDKSDYKYIYAKQRLKFLRRFYAYAKIYSPNGPTWHQWRKTNQTH